MGSGPKAILCRNVRTNLSHDAFSPALRERSFIILRDRHTPRSRPKNVLGICIGGISETLLRNLDFWLVSSTSWETRHAIITWPK